MAIAYAEFDSRSDTLLSNLKQRVLRCSNWSHQPTPTANTTLSSGAAPGATSINTAASIAIGTVITIGTGSPNPECRTTTAVTGSGPFTVSWTTAEPLTGTYSSGAAVGVGSAVSATSTSGAPMMVAFTSVGSFQAITLTAYPTLPVGGVLSNGLTKYIPYKRISTGAAATTIVHCRVSAWADGMYIDIEGPRGGETGADHSVNGSYRACFAINDITLYDSHDLTPAVCVIGGSAGTVGDTEQIVRVSRNRDNTTAWPLATLRTLAYPSMQLQASQHTVQPVARSGDFVQSPWVVFEVADGIRGRLSNLFFGGCFGSVADADEPPVIQPGSEMTYGDYRYRALLPFRTDSSGNSSCSYNLGAVFNQNAGTASPVVWVPVATAA